MDTIPPQFKELAESAELYDDVENIGKKYGFHIDQIGELDAEIRDVLNGVSKSSDFVKHLVERLEISSAVAKQVADEINAGIFDALKKRIQVEQDASLKSQTTNSIEQAGGFSVVREAETPQLGKPVTAGDREKILNNLENPTPGKERLAPKGEDFSEPLVDHLLSRPESQPVTAKVTAAPVNPIPAPVTPPKPAAAPQNPSPAQSALAKNRPTGPDPYREPVQ